MWFDENDPMEAGGSRAERSNAFPECGGSVWSPSADGVSTETFDEGR
jgi:hypothetical protein